MIPGNGYRLANDVLLELSLHLVQPICYTTILAPVTAGSQTVAVGSLGIPTNACYVDAQLLVTDSANGNEVISLTAVDPVGVTITATFAFDHPTGTVVSGATWPLQQATDAIFTQAEGLSYLSRAQNEFLSQCPVVYAASKQFALYNTIFQSAPLNMIEMERVSLSTMSLTEATLERDGAGTVTASFTYPTGLSVNECFTVYYSQESSFLGAFRVLTVDDVIGEGFGEGGFGEGGFGGVSGTVTWLQDGVAASSTSASLCIYNRLYEITQEEQTMQERTWRNDTYTPPQGWFEDRAGNYRWGLNARPQGNFPMDLLYSIRDTDMLTLADGFVAPDICVPYIKYKALEYFCSKDGVWASPGIAAYGKMRFDRGVMTVRRFFEGEQMGMLKQ